MESGKDGSSRKTDSTGRLKKAVSNFITNK